MTRLVPCTEPAPSLPEAKKPRRPQRIFEPNEFFGFDTETTRDGKKELRSYQAAWISDDGHITGLVQSVTGWFGSVTERDSNARIAALLGRNDAAVTWEEYPDVPSLRRACQRAHERLIYGDVPRTKKNRNGRWRRTRRKPVRCAAAFNGNFDLGVMSDYTELVDDMDSGGMTGKGVRYVFRSGDEETETTLTGLRTEALFLGALNVPFTFNRGELWDISSPARNLWGAVGLKAVGERVGLSKQEADFNDPVYAYIDAVITLKGAVQLSADLLSMGFRGEPDRFVSGATVSKDLLARHYQPFYLTAEQHETVWPAYFGGMTGPTRPENAHAQVDNVIYGDLDGAYSASGQLLGVWDWDGCEDVSPARVEEIVQTVGQDPSRFWEFGSLHIRVSGNFSCCPVRIAEVGEGSTKAPSASSGLVWARMTDYTTTLTLGDYLHAEPGSHRILGGVMATSTPGRSRDLFRMCADERSKYPKQDAEGNIIRENLVPNTWWKLAGNCLYGATANRNGPKRETAGKWFNALIASSITAAIRHCMWIVNEASGDGCSYNDTDSGMVTPDAFKRSVKALKPLNIGFSNKTHEELPGNDRAEFAVIHGSKRYAMMAVDGTFGAKCHGLGSWWAFHDGRLASLAHHPDLLRAVWSTAYPYHFGDPDPSLSRLKVFHKFSVRTKKVSNLVKNYALRQWDIPLEDLSAYGKAGNFGFIAPTLVEGEVYPVVAYEPEEAVEASDFTLNDVAMLWSGSWDKKFDYPNLARWEWAGKDVQEVGSVAHTQTLLTGGGDGVDGDISLL